MKETMTMATEQSPADRYLELCRRRVSLWEQAGTRREEHEQAEAFTRAFAELDATLREGGQLPSAWAGARIPEDNRKDSMA
jgi:hypothetical protein